MSNPTQIRKCLRYIEVAVSLDCDEEGMTEGAWTDYSSIRNALLENFPEVKEVRGPKRTPRPLDR